jgi:hypothetical protein
MIGITDFYCPLSCNYLDEEQKLYVYRPNVQPNWACWTAYELHSWETHLHLKRREVIDAFIEECDGNEECMKFFSATDPFGMIQSVWRCEFEMCLRQLLDGLDPYDVLY